MPKFDENKFRELKVKVEEAKAEADRAEGSHRTLMEQLEEGFGVKSIKGAQTQLETVRKEKEKAKKEYESAAEDYRAEWDNE